MFSRLQLGKPLNSGEKLNAVHGKCRDFAKELTEHKFIKNKISLKNTRYSYLSIAGQLCILGIKGIESHKFKDIEDFFNANVNFNKNSTKGKRVLKILDLLDKMFEVNPGIFRNRASITTFFTLINDLIEVGFNLDTRKNKNKIKDFYLDFNETLKEEVEKGAKASDPEYVVYQSKVTQGADNITSIKLRRSILKRKLIEYDNSFASMFDITESEEELSKLKRKDTIKELSDTCILSISNINKIYKSKNEEDLFKTTSEVLRGSLIISNPVDSKDEFKKIVDALYKIIYEGSGSLNRIPDELLSHDSIYFDIKHLRTDFFHDIEHGDEKKILKKEKIIKGIYEKYLGKSSFQELEVGELVHLQRKLLKNIGSELEKLKHRI